MSMYCSNCGKACAAYANFCSSCGAPVAVAAYPLLRAPIVRPRHPRMIAGVCSGLALRYGWDLGLVRIVVAALAVLTSGLGVLVYLAAWIIIPDGQYLLGPMAQAESGGQTGSQTGTRTGTQGAAPV